MLKNIFKPQPKARLKLDQILRGQKTNFRVAGCLIFKEWDAEDGKFYFWEEWELLGFDNYDSWVEFDHYSREVSIYEPVRFYSEKIDPSYFGVGKTYDFEDPTEGRQSGRIVEIGEGEIARIIGKNTHQVFEGEKMTYATLTNPTYKVTVEKYNNREFDAYKKRVLGKKEQKEIFGRVLTPFNWAQFWAIIFWIVLGGIILVSIFSPSCKTDTNGKEVCSYSNGIRGVHGGGGGGLGK